MSASAVAANTRYDWEVDLSTSGQLICRLSVDGGSTTSYTKTTNLPVSTPATVSQKMSVEMHGMTEAAVAKTVHLGWYAVSWLRTGS
jgi:hypothetical protein